MECEFKKCVYDNVEYINIKDFDLCKNDECYIKKNVNFFKYFVDNAKEETLIEKLEGEARGLG